MARKLKTYQTSLGFYDLAIAAPSIKAALEAWGAGSNLFHQGIANESSDPEVVAAAMSKPGIVLRRPVGSDGSFKEHAELPTDSAGDVPQRRPKKTFAKPKQQVLRTTDDEVALKAARAFEREQRRRESQRQKEEAAREKQRERRHHAIAKAQAALDKSEREHAKRVTTIEAERDALDKKSQAEDVRRAKEKEKLERALRRARE
jgi:colicin import membrane protein